MCIIFHGSIDVDGLEVLPVSGGESLCYVKRGVSPFRRGISSESLCIKSISGRITPDDGRKLRPKHVEL